MTFRSPRPKSRQQWHPARDLCASTAMMTLLVFPLLHHATAATFNVQAYGAKGDGITNDAPAIQAAVKGDPERPQSYRDVPDGTYLLGIPEIPGGAQITIKRANGLTLVGGSATTLRNATPNTERVYIGSSWNVTIENMTLDRSQLMFSQMTIDAVNVANKTVNVSIEAGDPSLRDAVMQAATTLLVFSDPASCTWGDHSIACAWYDAKDQTVCWPPSVVASTLISLGKWQLTLDIAPLADYAGQEAVFWNTTDESRSFNIKGPATFSCRTSMSTRKA